MAHRCEVLVIGAGPAGTAAAITLASRGVDVVLVDQADFPRDKICGDALIPDALAALDRLGVLAIGEAIGATYSFSEEGIRKALETGILAAELVAERLQEGDAVDGLEAVYAARLERAYRARFRSYETAQRWLGIPAFCNLLARHARRSAGLRSQLEDAIRETSDPSELFSAGGLLRVFTPWGYRS